MLFGISKSHFLNSTVTVEFQFVIFIGLIFVFSTKLVRLALQSSIDFI